MKLNIGFDIDRDNNYSLVLSLETQLEVFNRLYNNPFFTDWLEMEVGYNQSKREPFNKEKAIKALMSNKKDLCIIGYGNECKFIFTRNKLYYVIKVILTNEAIQGKVIEFRDFMANIAVSISNFKRLIGSQESTISAETQRKYNIEQEKSIFSYMSWLNVVSPLSYNGYYEKEDLLKAPFYEVREIAPDIIMIQAYKDPFDIENEESLNYLRNGVEYLNKHIVYLKEK